MIPVWDYVLMTEPLSPAQLASLGWNGPRGASDMSNQFHYFRLTADNRMLWGGYDAVYYNGGAIREEHAQSPATFGRLAAQFFAMFPQLEGVSFTHACGAIHGAWRRREPLRRPGAAGQALKRRYRTVPACSGPLKAAALPAGAGPVGGHPADQGVDRPRGRA